VDAVKPRQLRIYVPATAPLVLASLETYVRARIGSVFERFARHWPCERAPAGGKSSGSQIVVSGEASSSHLTHAHLPAMAVRRFPGVDPVAEPRKGIEGRLTDTA
jgi:hypothetical protein